MRRTAIALFCLFLLSVGIGLRAQNIQLHYDFGRSLYDKDLKDRPVLTSTVEKFHPDKWRIVGLLFFNNKDYFLNETRKAFCRERIISFLNDKGIALFDTASAIRRLQDNASDKFLEVVQPTDISRLLGQLPECKAIVTTGQKATDTLRAQFEVEEPKVGDFSEFVFDGRPMRLYRMPSSSRAYPLALDKKAAAYRTMYQDLQMLNIE